eukprot:147739_1
MKMSSLLVSLYIILFLTVTHCEDIASHNPNEPSTTQPAITTTSYESNEEIQNIAEHESDLLPSNSTDDMTGGGVWSSIGMIAVVICGCICLERLYSSCKKVYQKRTGRYGFSRLHNQTFNEFEGDSDDEDDDIEQNEVTTHTKHSDQDSV